MKKKLVYNIIFSLLLQVFTVLCGIVLPRLYLEEYGSEINGLVYSITQFLGVIAFLELGIGQVIQSALYKPLAERDNDQISKIIVSGSKYFRKIAGILIIYIIILILIFPYIAKHNFGWLYTASLIVSLSINLLAQYCFGIINRTLLNADQLGYIQCGIQIIALLCNTGISFLMIKAGASIQFVKLVASLILLMSPIITHIYVKKHYIINYKITYSEEPIKQKWNGIAQHLSYVVLEGTDTVVLTLFSTLKNVSVYSIYHMIIYGMMQLYRAATSGFHSIVGNLWAKQEIDRLNRVYGDIETLLHYAVVFLFSCSFVLILPFISVYTDGISDAEYIQPIFAVLLIFAHGFQCLRSIYNMPILAAGHYKQTQSCHIIAAILNLLLSIVTVKYWGLIGVAIGTLVALAYQTIWMAVYNSKNILRWPLMQFIKHIVVDLLTAIIIVCITSNLCLNVNSYLEWFVLALYVSGIAFVIIVVSAFVFYRNQVKVFTMKIAAYIKKKL